MIYQNRYKEISFFVVALKFIGLVFIVLISALLSNARADTQDNPFVSTLKNTQAVTDFTLAVDDVYTRLRVPTSYIDKTSTEGHGLTNTEQSINLKMMWPSLAATPVNLFAHSSEEYNLQRQLLDSGHWFTIKLDQGRKYANLRDLNLKQWWTPWPDAPPIAGFKQYLDGTGVSFTARQHRLGMRILIPEDKTYHDWVYFDCPVNSPSSPVGLYCVGHIGVGHFVYADYQFSMADIKDWKKIDITVRQLFDAMYVSSSN